jgi:hypothetical protein
MSEHEQTPEPRPKVWSEFEIIQQIASVIVACLRSRNASDRDHMQIAKAIHANLTAERLLPPAQQ